MNPCESVHTLFHEHPVVCVPDACAHAGAPRVPAVICADNVAHTMHIVWVCLPCARVSNMRPFIQHVLRAPVLCVPDARARAGAPCMPTQSLVYTYEYGVWMYLLCLRVDTPSAPLGV
jgi:hypothetical protein